ncbi:MAG: histidine phosphatase family protein [Clostridiales bacterium]|nr:histidine phosphatase family protein [Clostridiales bacterium]
MTKRFYLIRHGETDWNALRKFQGQSEVPLNENGRKQAEELALALQGVLPFDLVVASDLGRAVETAEILCRGYATPIETDPGFREMAFGEWEGLNEKEIRERWPADLQKWFDSGDLIAEGGESQEALYDRVWQSFRRWSDQADSLGYEKIAIVSHGGSGSALVCAVLGEPPQAMHKYMMGNTGVRVIVVNDEGKCSLAP